MAAKASVFIATSLDGYIARQDGGLDWLDKANAIVPAGEDCGYVSFMESVEVLVMGRNSYEKVLSFGQWPYGDKPVVVLSSNPINFPAHLPTTLTSSSETPEELHARLTAEGAKRLYIDGGNTIQRFLAAGLIEDLTITLIPVVLGEGIPLFGALQKDVELIHVETGVFDFGFVQVKYEVKK